MQEYKYKLLRILGRDFPVLLLIWFEYMVALWPLGLMQSWLAYLAAPMSLGLGVVFVVFSLGRGRRWVTMSFIALLAAIAGTAQGIWMRLKHSVKIPYHDEAQQPLNYDPFILKAVFIPAGILMVLLIVISLIISKFSKRGCLIVGSSEEYDNEVASIMRFGEAVTRLFEETKAVAGQLLLDQEMQRLGRDSLREKDLLLKLQDDLYFSGEPIYDFAFWLANSHLMLGVVFHHPLSPLETGHRFIICVVTCALIIFPVSLSTVIWPRLMALLPFTREIPAVELSLVRTVVMAAVVIGPRNLMKARLKKMAISDQENYLNLSSKYLNNEESSGQARAYQRDMYRKEAKIYECVGLLTILFCVGTVTYLKTEDPEVDTLHLVLDNVDGLGFAFVLEILFALVLPHKAKNPHRKCWGWFGRWRSERLWKRSS